MERSNLDRFDTLGRLLLWAAALVLGLSLIGALAIAASNTTTIPLAEDVQRESRGVLILLAIAGGITFSGILAGLGAIVSLLVAGRRDAGAAR